MPTVNYLIGPQDGWVQVAATPSFVRTSAVPHTHPYQLYAGSAAPSVTAASGTGTVIFATGVPTAGQTVLIGTETYTFRAAAALPFEVTIAATNLLTAVNFAAVVNSTSTLVTANNVSGTVTVTAKAVGTQGNYTMSTAATNVTVGGAAMTGGAAIVAGVTVCHHPFKVNVTMTEKLFARVINPVSNSQGADGRLRIDVFTIGGT